MHPDAARLFALDEALHAEADRVLGESGIGAILAEYGYQAVGSYAMRTMTWRDLDFELYEDPATPGIKWELGNRLAATGWCVRLQYDDFYRQAHPDAPGGALYWGARILSPGVAERQPRSGGLIWKLDMWSGPRASFTQGFRRRPVWQSLLNDDTRSHVLAIKEAVCHDPEYRKTMLSVHIYDAVLEHGVRDVAAFRAWWRATVSS